MARLGTSAEGEKRGQWAPDCACALGLVGLAVSWQGKLLWISNTTSARLEDVRGVLGQEVAAV